MVSLCVGLLSGCGTDRSAADIAKISDIKASFGPQFAVTEVVSGTVTSNTAECIFNRDVANALSKDNY